MDFLWSIISRAAPFLFVLFVNGSAIIWIASKNSNFPFTSRWQWKSPLAIDAIVFCFFTLFFGTAVWIEGEGNTVTATIQALYAISYMTPSEMMADLPATTLAIYVISYLAMAVRGETKKINRQLNDARYDVGRAGWLKLLLCLSICSMLIKSIVAVLSIALVALVALVAELS